MKDNTSPLITVGITCFNAENTIARAIESAIKQDWGNIEILIVDDCSTDGTVSEVKAIIDGHSSIRLIENSINTGVGGARKILVEEALGDFIVFFDDDDESLPDRVRTQYMRICCYEDESGKSLVACYASGRRVYPNGYEHIMPAIGSRPSIPRGTVMADYLLFYGKKAGVYYGAGIPTCALMARKSTFDAVGSFDPNFRRVEDVDFAIRLSLAGGEFIGCVERLFIQHATQGGDKTAIRNLKSEIQLAEKYKDYLQSVGRYEYAKRWPLIRYYHFSGQHGKMLKTLFQLFLRCPLKVSSHFLKTAPRRFLHESRMKAEKFL